MAKQSKAQAALNELDGVVHRQFQLCKSSTNEHIDAIAEWNLATEEEIQNQLIEPQYDEVFDT